MLQFLIGFSIGANVGLFLYAIISCGARADKRIEKKEVNSE